MANSSSYRLLLRIWRDVPFPDWMRGLLLRLINPSVMVGAMAVIQDDAGRLLLVEHTYRRDVPWGLPGGWLRAAESPEAGLAREVFEETGLVVRVQDLLAGDFWGRAQFDLLFRCQVESGSLRGSDETCGFRWTPINELPRLLPNQWALLRKAGLFG